MISIRDLLNKIKWDEKEDPNDYLIGYLDKIENKIIFIKFDEIKKIEGNFLLLEREEETYIPLHRIREVKKNGKTFWKR